MYQLKKAEETQVQKPRDRDATLIVPWLSLSCISIRLMEAMYNNVMYNYPFSLGLYH
jgi:hypothetical protein